MAGIHGRRMFNSFKKLPIVVLRGCTSLHSNSKALVHWAQRSPITWTPGAVIESDVLLNALENPHSPRAPREEAS